MNLTRMIATRPLRVFGGATVIVASGVFGLAYCAVGSMTGGPNQPRQQVQAQPQTPAQPGGTRTGSAAPNLVEPTPSDTGGHDPDTAVEPSHGPVRDVQACSRAAARFGQAWAQQAGDTPARWASRVRPHLSTGAAAALDRSSVYAGGGLPAGDVEDVAVTVDDRSCDARVEYGDRSTSAPQLRRDGAGKWVVVGLPEVDPSGGQRLDPDGEVRAPGVDVFEGGAR